MAEIVTHAFISTQPQSANTALVSRDEWNDGHVFSGGVNGQVLVYDNTQDNNMRWTDGRILDGTGYSIVSTTPTPIESAALITRTFNSPNVFVATVTILALTTVGAAVTTVQYKLDGVALTTVSFVSGQVPLTFTAATQIVTGSHTFELALTTAGGVNILTASIFHLLDASGV